MHYTTVADLEKKRLFQIENRDCRWNFDISIQKNHSLCGLLGTSIDMVLPLQIAAMREPRLTPDNAVLRIVEAESSAPSCFTNGLKRGSGLSNVEDGGVVFYLAQNEITAAKIENSKLIAWLNRHFIPVSNDSNDLSVVSKIIKNDTNEYAYNNQYLKELLFMPMGGCESWEKVLIPTKEARVYKMPVLRKRYLRSLNALCRGNGNGNPEPRQRKFQRRKVLGIIS
eukprot:gene5063-5562_t